MNNLDNYLSEQRRFARLARKESFKANNLSEPLTALLCRERAANYSMKAMAAHAMVQLELDDLARSALA